MNKNFLNIVLILTIFLQGYIIYPQLKNLSSEGVKAEGNYYVKNGSIYTDAIVINFTKNTILLTKGVRYTDASKIGIEFSEFKQLIKKLEDYYGNILIEKQIPDAEWGDVYRKHKITSQQVKLHDFSQLFTLRFSTPVPLDSITNLFRSLDVVEYVHGPVIYEYHDSPNDQYFQQNLLWHLNAVDAVKAWDITHGTYSPKIGIVDDGIMSTHNDLLGKIVGGNGVFNSPNDHGTLVAGVLAANTNNSSEGIASLGWNLALYNYGGPNSISTIGLVAQRIRDATNARMDIINMSFGTLDFAGPEDMSQSCWDKFEGAVKPSDYEEIRDAVADCRSRNNMCSIRWKYIKKYRSYICL